VVRAHDGVLAVGGSRYRVGAAGDEVVAADWGCRGTVRAVVVRPRTGEVFAFPGWARAGHDLRAVRVAVVAPGSRLHTAIDAHGCATLLTVPPRGRPRPVEWGAA